AAYGTPCRGPRALPALSSLAARFACSSASSGVGFSNELKRPFSRSIRSRKPCVNSTGESRPERRSGAISSAGAEKTSALSMSAPLPRPRRQRPEHDRQVAARRQREVADRLQRRGGSRPLALELLFERAQRLRLGRALRVLRRLRGGSRRGGGESGGHRGAAGGDEADEAAAGGRRAAGAAHGGTSRVGLLPSDRPTARRLPPGHPP